MNVFRREFITRLRSTIIWAAVMIVFMLMCMAKFDTITAGGGAAIQSMLKLFPHSIQAMYGMNGLDMTTVAGYFGVCYLFVLVILAVFAGLLGGGVLAREELTHTTEFLYVKPRARRKIVAMKLLVGLLDLVIVWAATVAGSVLAVTQFASMDGFWHPLLYMMLAALVIQLVFFSLGAAAVAIPKSSTRYAWIVAAVVFASYLFYVAAQLSSAANWLHYLSVFSYFNAIDILALHGLKLKYVAVCLAVSLVLLTVTFWRYGKRDMQI